MGTSAVPRDNTSTTPIPAVPRTSRPQHSIPVFLRPGQRWAGMWGRCLALCLATLLLLPSAHAAEGIPFLLLDRCPGGCRSGMQAPPGLQSVFQRSRALQRPCRRSQCMFVLRLFSIDRESACRAADLLAARAPPLLPLVPANTVWRAMRPSLCSVWAPTACQKSGAEGKPCLLQPW